MIKFNVNAARATIAKMVVKASRIVTENRNPKIGPRFTTKLVNPAIRRAFGDAISKSPGSPAGVARTFLGFATFAATTFCAGFAFATALATGLP